MLFMPLTMTGEIRDKATIDSLSRRVTVDEGEKNDRFLVSFSVGKTLTLIGGDEIELQ